MHLRPSRSAFFALALLWAAPAPAQEIPLSTQLGRLVEQLGDDEDPDRIPEAEIQLLFLGEPAQAKLREVEAGAAPGARERIRALLEVFGWNLPAPLRNAVGHRLLVFPALTPAQRLERLAALEPIVGYSSFWYTMLLVRAYERATDEEFRVGLADLLHDKPGAYFLLARDELQRLPRVDPLRVLRSVEFPKRPRNDPREPWPRWSDLPAAEVEVAVALCMSLRTAGLGDLAAMGFARELLFAPGPGSPEELHVASAALEHAGLESEWILFLRRTVAHFPNSLRALHMLAPLSKKHGWGEAHLALLRWLERRRLAPETAAEIELLRRGCEEREPGLPAADISSCLRLRGWTWAPRTHHTLLGRRAAYSAGSHPDGLQAADVYAFDRDTGDVLWHYAPHAEPNTQLEMGDRDEACLIELPDSLLVVHTVDSNMPGGTMDHTVRRTRLTRLSPTGAPIWSREYDLNPGMAFEVLTRDLGMFCPGGHQSRGRAWIVRLADGQVLSFLPMLSRPTVTAGGNLVRLNRGHLDFAVVDPVKRATLWEGGPGRTVTVSIGDPAFHVYEDAIYVTTGRHAIKLLAANGALVWVHEFAVDENTLGVIARAGTVHVVLDADGAAWRVVHLDARDGSERGSRESAVGEDAFQYGRTPVGWDDCRWVGQQAFLCRGRLVQASDGNVLRADGCRRLDLVPAHGGNSEFSILSAPAPESLPFVRFGEMMAEVNPDPKGVATEKVWKVIEELRKAQQAGPADLLERALLDWDPFFPSFGEGGADGK